MAYSCLFLVVVGCAVERMEVADSDALETVPEHPTYSKNTKEILDTWCVSCHGEEPTGDSPDTFRLDVYANEGDVRGAYAMAEMIAITATSSAGSMPPSGGAKPTDLERATLLAWVDDGAPE